MFLGINVVQLIEPIRRYSTKPFSQLLLLAVGFTRSQKVAAARLFQFTNKSVKCLNNQVPCVFGNVGKPSSLVPACSEKSLFYRRFCLFGEQFMNLLTKQTENEEQGSFQRL